jgi:DNA polymerase
MRREIEAVVHELRRLRREGEETIAVDEASLSALKQQVERLFPLSERKAAPPPQRVPSATRTAGRVDVPKATSDKTRTRKSSAVKATEVNIPPSPVVELASGEKAAQMKQLRKLAFGDSFCQSQVKEDKKIVVGIGNLDADIFFCGEAPGEEEEEQGEPFVGPAGQLLTKIIGAMGLKREAVYIGNIMIYRPPMPTMVGNRPPTKEEFGYCLPYLRAQVEIVRPKVIVALGKTAVDGLLGPDSTRRMGKIRSQWHEFEGIPVMPTYHPSYLLRNEKLGSQANRSKRMVWEDMLKVMERLAMPISEKQRGYFL